MMNEKAMPASMGGTLATYLWKEAVGLDSPWQSLTAEVRAEEHEYYITQVKGLMLALDAAGEKQYHAMVGKLVEPDGLDEGVFSRTTENLAAIWRMTGQNDWADAVDRIIVARDNLLDEQAIAWEAELRFGELPPTDPRRLAFGVQYRWDTAPKLAELLKIDLDRPAELRDLRHLLSARTAEGGRIPGRFYKTDKPDVQMTMGSLDVIFSADKSISVAEALSPVEDRQAIQQVHRDAVDAAMHKLAEKCTVRNRKNGLDVREMADVTWVAWHHRFSRRGDPQMHTHVSLLNVALSQESGKVSTIDTFKFHGFYHTVREVYHRELARGLTELGMLVEYDARKQAAVLSGIPDHILKHFSGRSNDAIDFLHQKGVDLSKLSPKHASWQMRVASSKTRQRDKSMYYVPGNGHTAWHARAIGQGYVPPPHYLDPQILQRRASSATQQVQKHSIQHRQSQAVRPRLDSRYNRSHAKYIEDDRSYGLRR